MSCFQLYELWTCFFQSESVINAQNILFRLNPLASHFYLNFKAHQVSKYLLISQCKLSWSTLGSALPTYVCRGGVANCCLARLWQKSILVGFTTLHYHPSLFSQDQGVSAGPRCGDHVKK